MAQIVLKLQLITPLLMFGAFNGGYRDSYEAQPEIRAASIRGGLRYWLRAVYGAAYGSNITGLHEAESRIFGSTSRGSVVTVRVQHSLKKVDFDPNANYARNDVRWDNALKVLPERFKLAGFKESDTNHSQSFSLFLVSHPLRRDVFNPAFIRALFLAFTLGGFGKRARRGGGALQIVNQSDDDLPDILKPLNMPDGAALAVELKKRFSEIQQAIDGLPDLRNEEGQVLPKRPYAATDIPAYPIFAPDHCRVFVGRQGESDYLAALKQMWTLTGKYHHQYSVNTAGQQITTFNKKKSTNDPVPDEWAWGYTLNKAQIKELNHALGRRDRHERRASALNMRVYQCDDGKYYPIVTIFRGGRRDEKWGRVQKVIDLFAEPRNNFTRAYGTGADWT